MAMLSVLAGYSGGMLTRMTGVGFVKQNLFCAESPDFVVRGHRPKPD
jgi:hypothetical protein